MNPFAASDGFDRELGVFGEGFGEVDFGGHVRDQRLTTQEMRTTTGSDGNRCGEDNTIEHSITLQGLACLHNAKRVVPIHLESKNECLM
jgi:hypothetical protein